MAEDVLWEPTPKQAAFLAADDFEVLYGGAVGGGKSDALLVDALCAQAGGFANPNHRAILFRRSFPELRDLIARSQELYPAVAPGADYNRTEKLWTFPSGARVEFGYLQHDDDRLKYRGRAWNWIGFDELTLWPTPTSYLYLFSRCRSTDRTLPRYIRATTNPDGPGQKWVMERWRIGEAGGATQFAVEVTDPETGAPTAFRRRFVPARLTENPHLADTGYREALLQLPQEDREALLLGVWRPASAKGAYYATELQALRAAGRITRVPYEPSVPVHTFWDLGWNDTTAIWFMQRVAGETRFIRAYENSGESLEHYARHLTTSGYNLGGTHHLPHDVEHRSLQTGRSALDLLRDMLPGLTFRVVPRVEQVLTGIQSTRLGLSGNVWFDAEGCADGIVALENYRKRYNARVDAWSDEPLHDRHSNYADALRQWGQGFEDLSGWSASAANVLRRRRARVGGMAV